MTTMVLLLLLFLRLVPSMVAVGWWWSQLVGRVVPKMEFEGGVGWFGHTMGWCRWGRCRCEMTMIHHYHCCFHGSYPGVTGVGKVGVVECRQGSGCGH